MDELQDQKINSTDETNTTTQLVNNINNHRYPEPLVKLLGKNIIDEQKDEHVDLFDSISLRLRELLRADNFSILTGAGSSYDSGGVTFSSKAFENEGWVDEIFKNDKDLENDYMILLKIFKLLYRQYDFGVEDFITFLVKLDYAKKCGFEIQPKSVDESKEESTSNSAHEIQSSLNINQVNRKILNALKSRCDLPKIENNINNHKNFIKRIISRPINLRRTNLFTLNYDLLFEKAMDDMGIVYVDGFIGGLRRFFHPESFNYDYYYPAGTTEGKVSRMEKVLHYYKLHGSLNWEKSNYKSTLNIYAIEKISTISESDNFLIYPTPMKEEDTIGFPYSELFRRFADAIQQPQSVLIIYGYSFGDYHINRIIYEALSIPSFQLIIVSFGWTDGIKNLYDHFKEEPSVGFIIGKDYANWETFVTKILPDIASVDLEERYQRKISNSLKIKDSDENKAKT
jgi:hypothetical protein